MMLEEFCLWPKYGKNKKYVISHLFTFFKFFLCVHTLLFTHGNENRNASTSFEPMFFSYGVKSLIFIFYSF